MSGTVRSIKSPDVLESRRPQMRWRALVPQLPPGQTGPATPFPALARWLGLLAVGSLRRQQGELDGPLL